MFGRRRIRLPPADLQEGIQHLGNKAGLSRHIRQQVQEDFTLEILPVVIGDVILRQIIFRKVILTVILSIVQELLLPEGVQVAGIAARFRWI